MLLALVGLAVPPAAFAAARRLDEVSLLQATVASCASVLLGLAAIVLARRGLRRIDRTLGRVGGEGTARVGRLLGAIALFLGLTAALALGFFGILNLFG